VASILDNWPEKVTSSKMLKGTKGVGKGSMAKVRFCRALYDPKNDVK